MTGPPSAKFYFGYFIFWRYPVLVTLLGRFHSTINRWWRVPGLRRFRSFFRPLGNIVSLYVDITEYSHNWNGAGA
jgi:hypothetical protein